MLDRAEAAHWKRVDPEPLLLHVLAEVKVPVMLKSELPTQLVAVFHCSHENEVLVHEAR